MVHLLNNFTQLQMLKVQGRSAYRSGPLLSGTRTVALYCGRGRPIEPGRVGS